MEPIRILMSVRSLVQAILWTGAVVALATIVLMGQLRADPPTPSVGNVPTAECTT